jgi:hypothetical protein
MVIVAIALLWQPSQVSLPGRAKVFPARRALGRAAHLNQIAANIFVGA